MMIGLDWVFFGLLFLAWVVIFKMGWAGEDCAVANALGAN